MSQIYKPSQGSGPGGDDLHVARFIVSAGNGADGANYTTIAAAYAAAVAIGGNQTIFIQPGTYTENITLSAGINLAAFECDAITPNVVIAGTLTATFAGAVSISGIQLNTNSSFFLTVSGSSQTVVNLISCYLNASNNTGISFTSSSSTSQIFIGYCLGNVGTTGVALFAKSGAGSLRFYHSDILNSGGSSASNTVSSGSVDFDWSVIRNPITTSGTGGITLNTSTINTSGVSAICVTHDGSGNSACTGSYFLSGGASAISVASPDGLIITESSINSSNTNAITGSGTIQFGSISFLVSSLMNTTTLEPLVKSNTAVQVKSPGAYPYTAIPQDAVIIVNASAARTINLNASPVTGQMYRIKDVNGLAATNNITVTPASGNIDGASTYVMNQNYESIDICYTGSQWSIL